MIYPLEAETRELLKRFPLPQNILEHSEEVSINAIAIGRQVSFDDLNLLKVSGLLHDIGRWKYCREKLFSPEQDFHEYETGKLLREAGYTEFGNMLQRHPLGGLTKEETKVLGFPKPVALMPDSLDIKIICIADKIRPSQGIITLAQKVEDYKTNQRLYQRYFSKMPNLLERTLERVSAIWCELENLGMLTKNLVH